MAAGLAALRKLGRELITELNATGDELRARLAGAGIAVNGSGSLLRLMSADPAALWWVLYRRGILAGTNGLLALSTAMSRPQIESVGDQVLDVLQGEPGLLERQ
jgi:glutamate-1-semialdehyde 2,1-aminomutase